ncbi:MAG: cohesin domain-containing protein [Saprospiraceae bacterium]
MVSLFLLNLPVFGQNLITTFTPTATNVTVGSTLSLELKVTNFTSITSVQFPITYNSSVLQFVNITGATLPGFAASNYNATNGKVTISWFPDLAQYPTGYTAPSNTTIFTMNFTVAATGTATVNIANVSPGIEVTRNGQNIQVTYATGGSNITATSNPATQFKVTANTIHIPKGQVGCMPVTVTNFTDMVSLSYIMHWDSSVLQYQNTKNWNLIDLGASNFNLFPAGSNNLIMSWFEQALTGITKPNGTAIYEVCFLAKGAVGSSSMVTINGTGFPPGGGPAEAITKASVDVWGPTSGVSDTMFVIAPPPDPNAVTFTADKDTTIVGGMTCVDVRVKNFKDILSAQFGITYDQTKIQFKSPIQFGTNPLGLTAANFNTNVPGEIKFTWFDQNALGIDLNDSTIIFSICFNAIGAAGTTSPFNIVSLTGLPIEVVKEPGGEVTPNVNNGHVHILAFIPPVVELVPTAANCNSSATGKITAKLIQGGPVITYTYTGSGIPGGTLTTTDTVVTNLLPGT